MAIQAIFYLLGMTILSAVQIPTVDGTTNSPLSPYCQQGATLPNISDIAPTCGSCVDRCGSIKHFRFRQYCSCDKNCLVYGDCCPDFQYACPNEFKKGEPLLQHFRYKQTTCIDLALEFEICSNFNSFVSVCGESGEICNTTSFKNLTEPNLGIPVTDLDTGITYINFWCAKCNNVTHMAWMKPSILCVGQSDGQSDTIKDPETVKQILKIPGCIVGFINENGIQLRPDCFEGTKSCPSSCNNAELKASCENSGTKNYIKGNVTYSNEYCALCAGERLEDLECEAVTLCDFPNIGTDLPEGFAISILFDFNPSAGLIVGQHPCPQYQARIGGTGECRRVACPDTLRFVNGDCLPLNLTVNFMTVTIIFNKTNDAQQAVSWFMDNELTDKVEEGIFIQLNQSMYSMHMSEVKFKAIQHVSNLTGNQFNISFTLDIMFDVNSTLNFGDNLHQIINITDYLNDQILLALTDTGVDLDQVEIIIDDSVTFNQKPLEDCTWFVFTKDEFTFINDSLRLYVTDKLYDETHYHQTGDKVIVCVAKTDETQIDLNVSQTLVILSLVLIFLSILCLLIRIILQFTIPYYNSFSARLHANLCLALMLAFIMVLVAGTIGHYSNLSGGVKGQRNVIIASVEGQHYLPLACALSGAVMYWFFMAAFIWMTALSIDAWFKLHPVYGVQRRFDDDKSIAAYAVPCWLIPLLISGGVLGLDFTDIDSRFRPEFGRRLCWFNQRYALLAYFGSVVAICMLLIIPFLIKAILNIPLQPKIRSTLQRHNVWIYLRLAALMGVCWVIGFVAAFIGYEEIWIVFIVLNASQGILIFISFVLNRKVLKQCCHRPKVLSDSSAKESHLPASSSTDGK